MGLNKEFLTALGIEKAVASDIMDEHGAVLQYWKDEVKKYKNEAAKLPDVEKELAELKKANSDMLKENETLKLETAKENPFEKKYNDLKKKFDDFKMDTETKERKTAVNKAVKAYFEEKNIKGSNLDIALRAAQNEISAIELAEGKIKDTTALDELIDGTLSGLISKTEVRGADVATPPTNAGGKTARTKDEIMNIKNTAERQQAIAENPELFGI